MNIHELKEARVLVTKQWKGDETLLDGELERIHCAICEALYAVEMMAKASRNLLNELDGDAFRSTGCASAELMFDHAADLKEALNSIKE